MLLIKANKEYMMGTEWFTTGRKDARYPTPFDPDFYLLINVAAGGFWSGSPDETSVFPRTLFVDYARLFQCPVQ